jgi:Xaa-Pro aminopeptidase
MDNQLGDALENFANDVEWIGTYGAESARSIANVERLQEELGKTGLSRYNNIDDLLFAFGLLYCD